MKKHRILGAVAAAGVIALVATGCGRGGTAEPAASDGAQEPGGTGQIVGVAMPTQQSERWIADGDNVRSQLEEMGYTVDLQYANDDIPTQVSQIENMISSGAEALIIASIDGTTLTDVLAQAGDAGIPVIAYDRLINGSPNVDYYTTFDNFQVGVQQATSLLTGLGLVDESGERTDEAGPLNVELFAGSPDDNNATFFWEGAMSVLQPLIDEGVLVVPSGQVDFEQAAILRWLPETAQERMENILTVIGDTKLDGVLSPYDGLSIGIISALTSGGYSTDALPVITGQDAEVGSVQSIIAGEQYSTIFKDTRLLAEQAVTMVDSILHGEEPEVNDTETYDNGDHIVPSYLLESTIVTVDNYEEVLIDSEYYTEDELS
ncbi:multiple monosaccharide ABC transporter substrate-binding protein [Agrococcus jenensis]|uniref:Putative multiple sugar transport system substrate-binding protein n=1 Tax=Agrococcus jenensis TaxID=46353 RepID=A0A3N2APR2_9MICO|nr:multiple monosaccharide ABC transporter substrate-binding protein [Agrococcus jenensis]ROR65034.1 putative multiple sugar transport system substrate-binding protein [Agrococcus jenensis]